MPGDARDRDGSGRPRNARPRDGLGRPLDPLDPAGTGTGTAAGEDRIPDGLVITGRDAAVLADRLLRDGRPFHAHEVLESAWKNGPPDERDLWQGLAQIAVGLTHARRGNARGAVALLRRGAERIHGYRASARTHAATGTGKRGGDSQPFVMDVVVFVAVAEDLADRIERGGLDGITSADLAPRLLAGA